MPKAPTPQLIAHLQASEGFRLAAYKCPAGRWTIGFGHTKGVEPGDIITRERALQLLAQDLREHHAELRQYVRVPLTPAQWDALLDMAFNVGVTKVARSSLLQKINAQAPTTQIQAEFMRWTRAAGRVLPGLVKRCQWRAQRWIQ